MSTKSRLTSGNIRIQFRISGLKLISRTFTSEAEADLYQARIESELIAIKDAKTSKLPIDMAALFSALHEDLKKAVQLLPTFGKVLGDVNGHSMTLAQLINQFMLQYNMKDDTLPRRLEWWSNYYGQLKISDISAEHIRHGINTLLTVGSTGKEATSPQTTNRFKANLSSVFEFGKDRYNLKSNPCREVKAKPEGKGRKRYLTPKEQQRFVIAAKHSEWNKMYLVVLMAITTGARRGELAKLRWNNINWDQSQAFCENTKNGTDKILQLTEPVMNELKRFRQIGNGWVFCNPRKPSSTYGFRKEWDLALKQADIILIDDKGEKLVFHTLRHTFCSSLANNGAELHEIAALAGHKSVQTTMRYTHTDSKRLASVIKNTFSELGHGL